MPSQLAVNDGMSMVGKPEWHLTADMPHLNQPIIMEWEPSTDCHMKMHNNAKPADIELSNQRYKAGLTYVGLAFLMRWCILYEFASPDAPIRTFVIDEDGAWVSKFPCQVTRSESGKPNGGIEMSLISMKQLLEAGVHFGHQTRRWNPKMKRYIFTRT